jgi:exopolysaccharide biosynthesis WecB/TagA/CpsF family protein
MQAIVEHGASLEHPDVHLLQGQPAIEVLGVPMPPLTASQALDVIKRLGRRSRPSFIAYANANTLNVAYENPSLREWLCGADVVFNDGCGVAIAAWLQRRQFPENLNGTDFNLRILELGASAGWSVFFLGSRPGISVRAAVTLRSRIPGLEIAGTYHGYFTSRDHVAERIRSSGAKLLMVGMGTPLQEMWLAENLPATGASIGVAVGGFFDFMSGDVPRAPWWMRRCCVEWVYRLAREPRRMWRRYVVGNPLFLSRVVAQLLLSRRWVPSDGMGDLEVTTSTGLTR